jgi:hypothetical protein
VPVASAVEASSVGPLSPPQPGTEKVKSAAAPNMATSQDANVFDNKRFIGASV